MTDAMIYLANQVTDKLQTPRYYWPIN